jgi:hypothetical protein
MSEKRGIAWYRHRMDAKTPLKVDLKDHFFTLYCTVTDVEGKEVQLTSIRDPAIVKWVCVVGPKSQIKSVDYLQ